ncbi:MAG: hypothetical protein GX589_08505 [Deltaproteobacteria bacterium]|nr:hypothetical protein [Deltaproteobacteria bacterium]
MSTALLLYLLFGAAPGEAQRGPAPKVPHKKAFSSEISSIQTYTYDAGPSSSLSDFIEPGPPDAYNQLTLANLRLMKEVAQPSHRPDDYDSDLTERVVSKMLTIQSFRSVSALINKSELQQSYRSAIRGVKKLQSRFRYSLQSGKEGLTVSRRKVGKKLIEVNLDFNLHQGVDPQINFGKYFRVRYDFINNRSILEYGFEF